MVIQTAQGKRSIDDDLVLCIDRHRNEGERCVVTVYLLCGEQVTGIFETAIPDDEFTAAGGVTRSRAGDVGVLPRCTGAAYIAFARSTQRR